MQHEKKRKKKEKKSKGDMIFTGEAMNIKSPELYDVTQNLLGLWSWLDLCLLNVSFNEMFLHILRFLEI